MTPRPHKRERGSSLTEFAIVLPLFVVIVYASLYLTDLGNFRLKATEITRYAAWSFTEHPLSDYEDFRHTQKFSDASQLVRDDLENTYFDLDGANNRVIPVPGAWSKTMMAVYQEPTTADLRNQRVEMLPSWGQVDWANPLSAAGMVLGLLGIGSDSESFVSGPFQRLRLDQMGQVQARADVVILPPIRPNDMRDALQAEAMAKLKIGSTPGSNLSRWLPSGQHLREAPGKAFSQTLVVDSWRVTEGFSAHPEHAGDYARAVSEISNHAVDALPGGQILSFLLNLNLPGRCGMVGGLGDVFGSQPACPTPYLFSRPYTARRSSSAHYRGGEDPGQADIFRYVGTGPQESGAVSNFETGPLYVDPSNLGDSPYLEALNKRGPNFMGCQTAEKRGCWE